MDIASLAAAAVAALAPYVKDAVEDFAGKAGEVALDKAKALFQRLKDKFSGDGYMTGTLDRFENADEPEKYAPQLEEIVVEAANDDAQFASDLEKLVKEIEAVGPSLKVVQKMKEARDVIGLKAGEMRSGTADVTQEIDDGKNVTGVEIDKIG